MEKLIDKYLNLSSKVEFYYQLPIENKIELFNFSVSMEKELFFEEFVNEEIDLSGFIYHLTKTNSTRGRKAPSKKYFIEEKKKKHVFKNMSKKEYHVAKKKIYKTMQDIKYIYNYKKTINNFLLENNFFQDNPELKFKLIAELNKIDEFINQNKNLGL